MLEEMLKESNDPHQILKELSKKKIMKESDDSTKKSLLEKSRKKVMISQRNPDRMFERNPERKQ